jgi:hypothetical protein
MYLTADKVVNGLVCAQRVLSSPKVFAERAELLPISIDAVSDVIRDLSGYQVTMRSVIFEGTHVFARVEKYRDMTAKIDVKHSLDEDWKRFVAAKELLHLIIDKEEDMSPYGDQTLDKLVRDGHIGIVSQNGDKPPAQSELIAEVAAMELLYPIQNRLADVKNAPTMPLNYAKLAIRYGIPVNFIDTVYSEDYFKMLTGAFAQFQTEQNA